MSLRYDYLSMPYTPNRQQLGKAGQRSRYEFLHRFAYTETMRGLNDEISTLLFYAPFTLIKDACQYIFKIMAGKVKDLRVSHEHSCRRKNGKCYWRVAVQVIELNEQFISLREFALMLVHRMERICNCKVKHYRLETFLNL